MLIAWLFQFWWHSITENALYTLPLDHLSFPAHLSLSLSPSDTHIRTAKDIFNINVQIYAIIEIRANQPFMFARVWVVFCRYMSLSFVSLTHQKKIAQDTNLMIVIDKVTNDRRRKEKKKTATVDPGRHSHENKSYIL